MSDSKFDDRQLSIVFSRASRLSKIGFLNVKREHIPQWIAFVSFVISNLQTIALLLSNGRQYLPVGNDIGPDVIDTFIKVFGFAEWFSYTNSLPVTIWACVMFMWIGQYSLLGLYINIKLTRRTLIPDLAQKYWSLLSYFHPLVFFYPMHTFCVKVMENYYNDNFTTKLSTPIIIFVYMIGFVNFMGSFVNTQIFYVVIKTKDALSAKNNFIRSKDIITKTIIPFLWVAAESGGSLPVIILLGITFDCISRDLLLFYYLPYFHIDILRISAIMQGAITSLAALTFSL